MGSTERLGSAVADRLNWREVRRALVPVVLGLVIVTILCLSLLLYNGAEEALGAGFVCLFAYFVALGLGSLIASLRASVQRLELGILAGFVGSLALALTVAFTVGGGREIFSDTLTFFFIGGMCFSAVGAAIGSIGRR